MIYEALFDRNIGTISKKEQNKIRRTRVAIIGLGGTGGIATELLARAGFGKLILIDSDKFEITNINRQILCTLDEIGKWKADIAAKRARNINPSLKVVVHHERLNEKNFEILKGADIILDGLDNLLSRVILSRAARKLKIPLVHGSVYGMRGQLTVFTEKTPSYEKLFDLPSINKRLTKRVKDEIERMDECCRTVMSPAPNLIGCLAVNECIKIAIGRAPILSPNVLFMDLMKGRFIIRKLIT